MSYELSFSQDFFGYGEEKRDKKGRPMNLWTAVFDYVEQEYPANVKDLHELVGYEYNAVETIMKDGYAAAIFTKAEKINTCSNLNTPVEVWLDSEGYTTVEVYR